MSNGARGSPAARMGRAPTPCVCMSLPASLSLATSFKSETASTGVRAGRARGETSPRGQAPGGGPAPATEREPLHAVKATHVHTKRITPHRARFARDWGE